MNMRLFFISLALPLMTMGMETSFNIQDGKRTIDVDLTKGVKRNISPSFESIPVTLEPTCVQYVVPLTEGWRFFITRFYKSCGCANAGDVHASISKCARGKSLNLSATNATQIFGIIDTYYQEKKS